MDPKFEVYKAGDDEWHWRLVAGNGEIVASGEGHESERDAYNAANTTADVAAQAAPMLKEVIAAKEFTPHHPA